MRVRVKQQRETRGMRSVESNGYADAVLTA